MPGITARSDQLHGFGGDRAERPDETSGGLRMNCGDTFLNPAPGTGPTPHLWIIVTQPCPTTHLCVVVNVTTLRNDQDQTVILSPVDHPFLWKPSVIRYSDAYLADEQTLRLQLAAGSILARDPCSQATLSLVQSGILSSPHTPKRIQTFCRGGCMVDSRNLISNGQKIKALQMSWSDDIIK